MFMLGLQGSAQTGVTFKIERIKSSRRQHGHICTSITEGKTLDLKDFGSNQVVQKCGAKSPRFVVQGASSIQCRA